MEMLNEMAVFVQVVESGHFSAAARKLGLTTSAVSRHVARLEAHMGGRLLQRTTRALALTELGTQVHEGAARMLSAARDVEALAGRYAEKPTGLLRVSCPVVLGQVWVAPRLPAFFAQYPEVDMQLSMVDRPVDLVEEGMDLAIRIARELPPGLAARPLAPVRYRLVASPAYLAAQGTPREPADLVAHNCLYLGYSLFGNEWHMLRDGERVSVKVRGRLTANHSNALAASAARGLGIALVPDFAAAEALAAGQLLPVLDDWNFDAPYTGAIYAVYTPGRFQALKVRALIDFLAVS